MKFVSLKAPVLALRKTCMVLELASVERVIPEAEPFK